MTKLFPPEEHTSVAEQASRVDSLTQTGSGYRILNQVLRDVQEQGCPEEGFYSYSHHIDNWSDNWANSMDDD